MINSIEKYQERMENYDFLYAIFAQDCPTLTIPSVAFDILTINYLTTN